MIKEYEKVLDKAGLLERPAEKSEYWLKMGKKEELDKVCEKYPEVPRLIILKQDMVKTGVMPTPRAIKALQDPYYAHTPNLLFQYHHKDHTEGYAVPVDMRFNDGTNIRFILGPPEMQPYTIDLIDGKFWVVCEGELLEELNFRERPHYYGKKTRSGQPMETIIEPINGDFPLICSGRHCAFWNEGLQCRFCDMDYNTRLQMKMGRGFTTRPSAEDVYDAMCEYLKQNRRFRHAFLTGGSDLKRDFDREYEYTLSLVDAVNRAGKDVLNEPRFPLNVIMTPLEEDLMVGLRDAGMSGAGLYIEAWPRERFEIVVPGKNKYVGFDTWIERTVNAVKIFGKGNVITEMVLCEMAPAPYGVGLNGDIDEAVGIHLDGVDFFLSRDVIPIEANWFIVPGSFFYRIGAIVPPLEFFVRVGLGQFNLMKQKGDLSCIQMCYKSQCFGAYADYQRYL